MSEQILEQRLAEHCAPTLLGAKAASLFSLSQQDFPELPQRLRNYNRTLHRTGVRFMLLRSVGARWMILVYRPALLRSRLAAPEARTILASLSYPDTACLGALLRHLKGRFSDGGDFPHEIGLFLDYPAADVAAFMEGRRECKLCGYWKVYCDVDAARETFACYDACRLCLCRMLAEGNTISQLLFAA